MKPITLAYVPNDRSDFVELARTQKGKLYRKQILHVGQSFVHPGDPSQTIDVTPKMANTLRDNFRAGYCDIVQVPVVDGGNKHSEDPLRNLGEVVDLEVDDKGVYAIIDARKKDLADQLGETLIGASAMMHMNYADTRTGRKVGPTLLHVAVTNRPYVTNLSDFEEIVAASAESMGEKPVFLAGKEDKMDLEELLAMLRTEHGIDVEELQRQAEAAEHDPVDSEAQDSEFAMALSNVLEKAGIVELSEGDDLSNQMIAEAVVELAKEKVELSNTVSSMAAEMDTLRLAAAETEIDGLVSEGKVLPTQKAAMLELRLTNQELFDSLVPESPIVAMSAFGTVTMDERESGANDSFQEEVERYLQGKK